MDSFPLLSLLLFTLPVGAALIWLAPSAHWARWVALGAAVVDLVVAVVAVARFDASQSGFQLVEQVAWIPSLNIQYLLGVDGISVLFVPLTIILFIGVMVASWNSVRKLPRLYYTLLLLQESATLGIFCSLDTILFFLFWEFSLIPLYFLVSLWGIGPNRRYASLKYTLVMLSGGVLLLFAFVVLAFNHSLVTGAAVPSGLAFDLPTLLGTPLGSEMEMLIFLLLFLGFAVKMPLFPLHTWLPVMALEGPVVVTSLLVGLKLGVYGLIRFAVPLAPEAAQELHWLLAGLGVTGILYGAVAALAQTNLRRMLAYSSLSHVGLVVLGVASFNLQGLQGAVMQLLNFVIIAGGLFLLTGFLHQRVGSSDVVNLGGAARSMPLLAGLFLVLGLASMGVPGTSGFPAEFLLIFSALETHTGAGLAALFAMVVSAGYFLTLYRRAFHGPANYSVVAQAQDLQPRELWFSIALVVLVVVVGLYPAPVLDVIRATGEAWVARLN